MRRTVGVLFLAALLAGCTSSAPLDPARDGTVLLRLVNEGPSAFVALEDDTGSIAWSERMLAGEMRLARVDVTPGGCSDFYLRSGTDGAEADRDILLVAPCDYDPDPVRVPFGRT